MFGNRQLGSSEKWQRQNSLLISRDINQRTSIHHDATNFLWVIAESENNTPSGELDFYIDWFELDYWHAFKASGGSLEFNSDTEPRSSGTVQYRVTNLRRPEIELFH